MAAGDKTPLTDDVQALADGLRRALPGHPAVHRLQRLTAGATQQTWSFDAQQGDGLPQPLILRRAGGGLRSGETLPLTLEAALVQALQRARLPVPEVQLVLAPVDGLGEGYVMRRIDGETLPRRIQRDAPFAAARAQLVRQMGQALGRIHRVPVESLPRLATEHAPERLDHLRRQLDALAAPRPVFELALQWLLDHAPGPAPTVLVHGDFRLGNLMVDTAGLRAVLDWELAHFGDAAEDLAWACLMPWRFGQIHQRVAGLGALQPLLDAHAQAGGPALDARRVFWWEVAGSLRWGLMCAGSVARFREAVPSIERAMIARRASESELDLLRLLGEPEAAGV
jgi:aminoglycoside phosphotransferase (APT) family kinase protein